jgi:hypothetical protein
VNEQFDEIRGADQPWWDRAELHRNARGELTDVSVPEPVDEGPADPPAEEGGYELEEPGLDLATGLPTSKAWSHLPLWRQSVRGS